MMKTPWTRKEEKEIKDAWRSRPKGENLITFGRRLSSEMRTVHAVRAKVDELMESGELEDDPPSVLFMDIETFPIEGEAWSPWDTNILRVKKDWCVATWAAKWQGDNRMMYDATTFKEAAARDDKRICLPLWHLFEEADIVIAQNGKKFDIPKMNSRWWKHGFGPPSSYRLIDTLEEARKTFSQTYNSLDELGKFLGVGGKMRTGGKELWFDYLDGVTEAKDKMIRYNKSDVELLERVYDKMKGWMPNHPRMSHNPNAELCPVCRDVNIKDIGYYTAKVKQYKEFRCGNPKCKAVWHNTKAER